MRWKAFIHQILHNVSKPNSGYNLRWNSSLQNKPSRYGVNFVINPWVHGHGQI